MTSSGRILKSNQLENHEIVLLGNPAVAIDRVVAPDRPAAALDEPLLFTASEVEDLCEKARASGAADAATTLRPALDMVADALTSFAHDHEIATTQAHRGNADAVLETATAVARWVLGREMSEPNALLDVVQRALNEPLAARTCTLCVHPEMVPLLYEIAPDSVEVAADHTLELGEFRVEHDGPEVAFRFDTTLERVKSALSADTSAGEGSP